MSVDQIFRVATEFRFDIGHAVLASETLQEKVQGISDAADEALLNFQHLGAGIVAQMGLGGGGVLGALYKAIQVSDKFNTSALSFANVISSNMQFLQGDISNFNDRLLVSKSILMDVAKVANQFSLDESSLLQMTKLLAPVLVPHGAAGKNFGNAVDLGRNVLKAAPSLGLQPGEIEGQLIRTLLGQANMQDTLFRRLLSETQAFSGLNKGSGRNGGATSAFNAMSFEKRFEMLHKGLNQFASDMDVINGNARSLQGNLTRLKNIFGGINSILRPLGDAILPAVTDTLHMFAEVLDKKVRAVIENISGIVKTLVSNPENTIVNLLQAKALRGDVKRGGELFGLITTLSLISHVSHFLGIEMAALLHPFRFLLSAMASLIGMVPWLKVFAFVARVAWFAFSRLLIPLTAAVAMFQLLSRAKAIARVEDAKNLINMAPQLTAITARLSRAFSNIILPFTMAFDALAHFLAPIFQVTTWLDYAMPLIEGFAQLMEFLGKVSILATASFQGLVYAIAQLFDNLRAGKFGNLFDGVNKARNAGIDDFLEANAARLNGEGNAVVNQVTNIGKVEIRNDFKEQQEPDRIAFTVKEQLMKAARNPSQGRGIGLKSGFVGAH